MATQIQTDSPTFTANSVHELQGHWYAHVKGHIRPIGPFVSEAAAMAALAALARNEQIARRHWAEEIGQQKLRAAARASEALDTALRVASAAVLVAQDELLAAQAACLVAQDELLAAQAACAARDAAVAARAVSRAKA